MKNMALRCFLGALFLIASPLFGAQSMDAPKEKMQVQSVEGGDSCVKCHEGIESIRDAKSDMMAQILAMGQAFNDSGGCAVCHGGDPDKGTFEEAHKGAPAAHPGGLKDFVRDPGSIWIADKTCGMCHADTLANVQKSLMMTEAGKIQGNLHSWGSQKSQKVIYGNHAVKDEDGKEPAWGTKEYKEYMVRLIDKYPNQFPTELKQIPLAPQGADDFKGKSEDEISYMASLTYQRSGCQACHVGVRGRKIRGDWRGMGCSACHIPYGIEAFYEGKDPTIDKSEKGHLLTHQMQSSREVKVKTAKGVEFSGIHPVTCGSCHSGGKRIGVSYLGLMEQPYGTPFKDGVKDQDAYHGSKYKHIKEDLHFEAGMTCQDCHTSIDVHGDGTIFGTTLAQVEIECSDCHGTNDKFPWELRLGYGEDFKIKTSDKPRGLAQNLQDWMKQGTVYDKEGGYLLSARGNPLGNVVKVKGETKVIAHLASGKDLEVPLVKNQVQKKICKSKAAYVAMNDVKAHMNQMECYTCHATWAPQCYGCHVKMDYGSGKTKTDWIASASTHFANGETSESTIGAKGNQLFGTFSQSRTYTRWENPALGVNGEGLITPIIPGCQVIYSIIGPDGKTVTLNKRAKVADDGAMLPPDMSPTQPHTISKVARTCESCHSDPKAIGYGINDGQYMTDADKDLHLDIQDLRTKEFATEHTALQLKGIEGLNYDLSQVVTRDGKLLQSVGTHWPDARALDKAQRDKIEKVGVCIGCHQNMSKKEIWDNLSTNKTLNADEHVQKMNELATKAAKVKK